MLREASADVWGSSDGTRYVLTGGKSTVFWTVPKGTAALLFWQRLVDNLGLTPRHACLLLPGWRAGGACARPGRTRTASGGRCSGRTAYLRLGAARHGAGKLAALAVALNARAAGSRAGLPELHQPPDRGPAGDLGRDRQDARPQRPLQIQPAQQARIEPAADRLGLQRLGLKTAAHSSVCSGFLYFMLLNL